MTYEWEPGMREISGFGGTYELACRAMVKAGLEWWDAHPDTDPKYRGYKNIHGIIDEMNDDAKALTKAIVKGADQVDPNGGVTGAMHEWAVHHVLAARRMGWPAYVEEMNR